MTTRTAQLLNDTALGASAVVAAAYPDDRMETER